MLRCSCGMIQLSDWFCVAAAPPEASKGVRFKIANRQKLARGKGSQQSTPKADGMASFCHFAWHRTGRSDAVRATATCCTEHEGLLVAQSLPPPEESKRLCKQPDGRCLVTPCAAALLASTALLQNLDTALCSRRVLPQTLDLLGQLFTP